MADKNTKSSRKQAPDQIGESDDFVVPVAPPPAPLGHEPGLKRTGGTISEPSSSTNAYGDRASAPSEPRAVSAPAVDEPYSETPSQSPHLISEPPVQSAPWYLVILLVFLVIGLLLVIVNKSNERPRITPPVFSSGIDEIELVSARGEAESMRKKASQMGQRISELEQQQEAERKDAETRVKKLLREKKILEDSSSNSIAEVERLKRQLLSTNPKDPQRPAPLQDAPSSMLLPSLFEPKDPPRPAPLRAEPVVSNNSTLYRVTGLIEGDTLNVRTGPGASNPIVIRLYNGVELSVVDAALTNGSDIWLPCLIDKTFTDPSTGLTKSMKLKGWVNSIFVEQVPGQ